MKSGTLFWITGLAGSGKTTVASRLYERLKQQTPSIVLLDGDPLRQVFGAGVGYALEERKTLAFRYSKLCHLLTQQNIHVICACIALFHDVHQWNRDHISQYFEVFLDVPMSVLESRDQKQLYSRAKKHQINQIVGVDIQAEYPLNPDCTIQNYGSVTPEAAAEMILHAIPSRCQYS